MLLRSCCSWRSQVAVLLIGGQCVRPPCRACGWRRRGVPSCLLSMIFNGWMLPPPGCSTSRCAAWAGCRWASWRASVPAPGARLADRAAGVRLDLGRALPAGRCARHVLGPLSLGALQHVLKRELGRSFPHRTLARIARVAGGNPFFALELARSVPEDLSGAADLTLPEDLRRVVEDRIAGLPGRTREALLVAAVAASPTVELVSSAASPGTTPEDPVEAAVAAGIVRLEGAQVRFAHPLFAAGLYSSASPGQRRLAHRRLVPLITGIEEQARHRALGAEGPEEGVAGALDAAAEHARRRGAPEVAADLAEHARALTPPHRSPDRQRRTIKAAEYRFHAGQLRHGRELLEAVLAEEPDGLIRAGALRLLGEIHYHEDSFDKAVAALQQALGHAGDNPGLHLTIELSLTYAMVSRADFAGAADHAGRALALADLGAEPASAAEALAVAAMAELPAGAWHRPSQGGDRAPAGGPLSPSPGLGASKLSSLPTWPCTRDVWAVASSCCCRCANASSSRARRASSRWCRSTGLVGLLAGRPGAGRCLCGGGDRDCGADRERLAALPGARPSRR